MASNSLPADADLESRAQTAVAMACGCCFVSTLAVIISIFFIIFPAIFFIGVYGMHHRPYYIYTDQQVQANITATSRTNDTLSYNLDLSISLRNPNALYDLHHHKIDAMSYYYNNNTATGSSAAVSLNPFSQGPKSNALITPSFKGLQINNLDDGADHDHHILVVKLYLENAYHTGYLGWEVMSEFECDFKVDPTTISMMMNYGQKKTTSEAACEALIHRRGSFPIPLKVYFFLLIALALAGALYYKWFGLLALALLVWFWVIV